MSLRPTESLDSPSRRAWGHGDPTGRSRISANLRVCRITELSTDTPDRASREMRPHARRWGRRSTKETGPHAGTLTRSMSALCTSRVRNTPPRDTRPAPSSTVTLPRTTWAAPTTPTRAIGRRGPMYPLESSSTAPASAPADTTIEIHRMYPGLRRVSSFCLLSWHNCRSKCPRRYPFKTSTCQSPPMVGHFYPLRRLTHPCQSLLPSSLLAGIFIP